MDSNLLNAATKGHIKPFKKKALQLEKIINESKDTILHVNIKTRTPSTEFVQKILKICPPLLLQANDKGNTPLHVAARRGKYEIVEVLLKCARDQTEDTYSEEGVITKMLTVKNNDGKTTLDIAMEYKNIEVVKKLVKEANSDSFDFTSNIRKILNFAAKNGEQQILDAVANGDKGKEALHGELKKHDYRVMRPKDTILHININSSESSTKFVEYILDERPSLLLQVNANKDTPLHVAAKFGKNDIVRVLLKRAKDYQSQDQNSEERAITEMLKTKNSEGKTAFDVAIENEKLEVVKMLIKEVDPEFFCSANNISKILNLAAKSGDHEILDNLDVVTKSNGNKALREALWNYDTLGPEGNMATDTTMMTKSSDSNLAESGMRSKDTILHIYIKFAPTESIEFVEKVLELCPSLLRKPNAEGDTPLHFAAKCGKSATTKVLLKLARYEYNQDTESGERAITEMLKKENSEGKTAFDLAMENEEIKVVKMLIKEAKPDFFDVATHIGKIIKLAAESGDHEILDAITKGNKGKNALHQEVSKYDNPVMPPNDTILHVHIKYYWTESIDFVEKVLELCPSLLLKPNAEGDIPLHVAAKCGKSATTEVLLKRAKVYQSQDQNIRKTAITEMLKKENSDGKTAFDVAVEYEEIKVMKILIKEADPDFFDFSVHIGKIINLAAKRSDHKILDEVAKGSKAKTALHQELSKYDIPGTHESKDTILHTYIKSVWWASTDFVNKLLEICPSLQLQVDDKGDTPFNVAVMWNEFDIAEVLLKHAKVKAQGQDREKIDDRKDVVKCGQYAFVKVLKAGDQTQEKRRPDWKIWEWKNYDDKTILDIAVENYRFGVVNLLIKEAGIEFLDFDNNFRKILYFAARTANHQMVDAVAKGLNRTMALEEAVVNPNIPAGKQSDDTMLHVHIKSSKKPSEFIKEILDKCPTLLVKVNEKGDTPLHVAAKCGHYAIVEFLLQRAIKKPQDLEIGLKANCQMLDKAKIKGNKANWKMLRLTDDKGKNRADWQMLRMTNSEGNTALHEAVRHGKTKVVEILTKGADVNFSYFANHASETPLYLAAAKGYYKMVRAIIKRKESAAHNGPNGMTALHAAVMNSNISVAHENPNEMMDFLDSDSDDSDTDDSGYDDSDDLQSYAIIQEICDAKKFLTKTKDKHGWTPLHYAAYHGLKEKVSLLLKFDESAVYTTDKDRKMTALHMAASQGHKDIIEIIVSKCEECCAIEDIKGWNVLHFAMLTLSREDLIDLLKNPLIGNLINKTDVDGNTPLHIRAAAYRDSFFHIGDCQAVNSKNISVEHMLKHGYHKLEEDIQTLFEEHGNGQYQKGVIRERKDDEYFKIRSERRKKYYDGLKDTKEYHLLVATLIATVTFTAAFTIPGGFHSEEGSDQGTAILNKHLAFRMFIITDTIGMTLSLSAVFVHFIMSFQKFQRHESLLTVALWLTIVAMGTVVVAFVTGLYAVLAPSFWLAIATSCIALSFFLLVLCALIVLYRGVFLRWLRAIRKLRLQEAGSGNLLPTHFKKEN